MRSSSFLKLSGMALLALILIFSGVLSTQAGPLLQATSAATATVAATTAATQAATAAATDTATQAATAVATQAATAVTTAAPTQLATAAATVAAPTKAATSAATVASTAAATLFPPCPGTTLPTSMPTTAPSAVATGAATSAATSAVTEPGYLGISARLVDNCGVRVSRVVEKSPADAAGLKVGDVIVPYNNTQIMSLESLQAVVLQSAPGTKVTFVVKRGEAELTIVVTLGKVPPQTPATATPAN